MTSSPDPLIIESLILLGLLGVYTWGLILLSKKIAHSGLFYLITQVYSVISFIVITGLIFLVFGYITHPSMALEILLFWFVMAVYMTIANGVVFFKKTGKGSLGFTALKSVNGSRVYPVASALLVVVGGFLARLWFVQTQPELNFTTTQQAFLIGLVVSTSLLVITTFGLASCRKLSRREMWELGSQTLISSIALGIVLLPVLSTLYLSIR